MQSQTSADESTDNFGSTKATDDIGACAASGCIVERCVVDGPVDVDSAPFEVTD